MDIEVEHFNFEDLEEKFQISVEVFFSSECENYDGVPSFSTEIKKKENTQTKILNIELGKPDTKHSRKALF